MRMRWLIWIVIIIRLIACTAQMEASSAPTGSEGEAFALYQLADDQIRGMALVDMPLEALVLADVPLLTTADLISYERSTHTLELTDEGYQKVADLMTDNFQVGGIPFVVVSGGHRIYAGAFWTPLSSQSFDGVVIMDPIFLMENNTMQITLGYPAVEFFTGTDPRADARLMDALEAAGVLK